MHASTRHGRLFEPDLSLIFARKLVQRQYFGRSRLSGMWRFFRFFRKNCQVGTGGLPIEKRAGDEVIRRGK